MCDCCFQNTKINDHCWGNYFPKGSYKVLPIRLMYTSYSIDITFPSRHHLAWQIAEYQYQCLIIKIHVDRSRVRVSQGRSQNPQYHISPVDQGISLRRAADIKVLVHFFTYSWTKNDKSRCILPTNFVTRSKNQMADHLADTFFFHNPKVQISIIAQSKCKLADCIMTADTFGHTRNQGGTLIVQMRLQKRRPEH